MTDLQKTKCPNCHSIYPVPMEQRHNDLAKARCPKCKTAFLVNANLVQEPIHSAFDDFDIAYNNNPQNNHNAQGNVQNIQSASINTQQQSEPQHPVQPNPPTTGDDVFDSIAADLTDPSNHNVNPFDSSDTQAGDLLGSLDDMSDWIAQQTNAIHAEKMQEQGLSLDTDLDSDIESNLTGDDWGTEQPIQSTQQPSPKQNQTFTGSNNTQANLQMNPQNNNMTPPVAPEEVDNSPELNELLNNYGVRTEEIQPEIKPDRLEKMRERSLRTAPTSQQVALKKSPVAFLLWLVGCLLLIALLFAQYAIFNVNDLIKNPAHRSKLIAACNILSCSLPSAELESFAISNLNHRPSQTGSASAQTDIVAAINNTSNQAQLYPNLKVTINGQSGKLGEFIATPADYLPVEQEQLAAQQGKLFMFTVNLKDSDVSSINIEPFY